MINGCCPSASILFLFSGKSLFCDAIAKLTLGAHKSKQYLSNGNYYVWVSHHDKCIKQIKAPSHNKWTPGLFDPMQLL